MPNRPAVLVALAVSLAGVTLAATGPKQQADQAAPSGPTLKPGSLLYANFENSPDGKPVSSRGGAVNLWGYQEQPTMKAVFKGPSLIRTSKLNQNHGVMFEYELVTPNEWEGVALEIQGRPEAGGVLPEDDVSEFKEMLIAAYATGTQYVRVEIKTAGNQRLNEHSAYPMYTFKLKDGFNTYKIPLKAFAQPAWVTDTRIDPKEVLKRLTAITFAVYCEQTCRPAKGTAVVDDIAFEK